MSESRLRGPEDIRTSLVEAIKAERRDTLVFSVVAILLTPLFVLATITIILMGVAFIGLVGGFMLGSLPAPVSLATGVNVFLAYVFVTFLGNPRAGAPRSWMDIVLVGGALGVFAMLLVLTYVSGWPDRRPGLFWTTYAASAPVMLAMLGTAYMPRDSYYLGWYESIPGGGADEKALEEGASDLLRFAAFVPALILECYGRIFGSFWLWRRLDPGEIRLMVETLVALGAGDSSAARDRMLSAPQGSSADVLRWLSKLGFVRHEKGALRLTDKGTKFLTPASP